MCAHDKGTIFHSSVVELPGNGLSPPLAAAATDLGVPGGILQPNVNLFTVNFTCKPVVVAHTCKSNTWEA